MIILTVVNYNSLIAMSPSTIMSKTGPKNLLMLFTHYDPVQKQIIVRKQLRQPQIAVGDGMMSTKK